MPLIRPGSTPSQPASAGDSDALTSGSADERWAAARALARAPDGAQRLGQALANEHDPRVRDAIFTSLARIAAPASVEAVLPCLRSDDASLRTGALDALRAMPEAVKPRLAALLADPDADVRLLACEIVRAVPAAEASPLLCELIDREVEVNVCAAAVEVLAEIAGPEAQPALARCAERFASEPFLAFSIKVAAQRIGAQGGGVRD